MGGFEDLMQPILPTLLLHLRPGIRQPFDESNQFRQQERTAPMSSSFHYGSRDVALLESDDEVGSIQIVQSEPPSPMP